MAKNQSDQIKKARVPIQGLFLAGLVAGSLDITAALLNSYLSNGVKPERVFRFIASGVFGRNAFTGGNSMIGWGIIFHFTIAYIFALFFAVLYPKLKILSRNIFLSGILYGIFAWIVMTFIVVPLSNTPPTRGPTTKGVIFQLLFHMFLVGIPIALITHSYFSKRIRMVATGA
jgi:hypothetical protein